MDDALVKTGCPSTAQEGATIGSDHQRPCDCVKIMPTSGCGVAETRVARRNGWSLVSIDHNLAAAMPATPLRRQSPGAEPVDLLAAIEQSWNVLMAIDTSEIPGGRMRGLSLALFLDHIISPTAPYADRQWDETPTPCYSSAASRRASGPVEVPTSVPTPHRHRLALSSRVLVLHHISVWLSGNQRGRMTPGRCEATICGSVWRRRTAWRNDGEADHELTRMRRTPIARRRSREPAWRWPPTHIEVIHPGNLLLVPTNKRSWIWASPRFAMVPSSAIALSLPSSPRR